MRSNVVNFWKFYELGMLNMYALRKSRHAISD